MARAVFYSFHYKPDNWRASKVRQMGALEGNQLLSDNDWEDVTSGGEQAIKNWIAEQMRGKLCEVVLIGASTAGRKWVKYEIEKAWDDRKGVVGVYIHNLLDSSGRSSSKGANPFGGVARQGRYLSSIVKAYDPPYVTSTFVYEHIRDNVAEWVEEAIQIRAKY